MKTQNKPEKKNVVNEFVIRATFMVKAQVAAYLADTLPIFPVGKHPRPYMSEVPEPLESIVEHLCAGEHVAKHISYVHDAMSFVNDGYTGWFNGIKYSTHHIFRENFDRCYDLVSNFSERNKFLEVLKCFIANDCHKEYIWGLATMIVEHVEFHERYAHLLVDAGLTGTDFSIDFVWKVEKLPKKNRETAINRFIENYRHKIKEKKSLKSSILKDFMKD